MRNWLIPILIAALVAFLWTAARTRIRAERPADGPPTKDPEGRVAAAREQVGKRLVENFAKAGVTYPPRELFLRVFKREAVLEVWASDGAHPFILIQEYAVKKSSGQLGPKRREGDYQVPEGFYLIDRFNPTSSYHLSLRVNYPNASDRVLSNRLVPGSDIYVHGGEGSVGCLPLGDDGIDEVYLMALDAGNRDRLPIHIFPARMSGPDWEKYAEPYLKEQPSLARFWGQLQSGFDAFETAKRLPLVAVDPDGSYRVKPASE